MRPPRGRRLLFLLAALAALAALASAASGATIDETTVIEGQVEWDDAEYTVSAGVTVAPGGHLNVTGSTVTFVSNESVPNGIVVEEGGRLTMTDVTCQARDHPWVMIVDGGEAVLLRTDLSGMKTYEAQGSLLELAGGLTVHGGLLHLEDVMVHVDQLGLYLSDSRAYAEDLVLVGAEGSGTGMIIIESLVDLVDVTLGDVREGIYSVNSTLSIQGGQADTLDCVLALGSDVAVQGLDSTASRTHMTLENGTASVGGSEFHGGSGGVVVLLGYAEVEGCEFLDMATAIELLYCEAAVRDCTAVGCYDDALVLVSIGYLSDGEPRFELDNVTVRDGTEAGVSIRDSSGLVLSNMTITGQGDGVDAGGSNVTLRDVLVSDSSQWCAAGCSYESTGTGILLETSAARLENVTVSGSNGPGLTAYFSSVDAVSSAFVGGNMSGILLVYSSLSLADCQVRDNAWWGVEALAYAVDPEEQDARWGNGLADIRFNMTINALVEDQHGTWLSHARVTARSGDVAVGPKTTGFGGSSPTFELPVFEWTDGEGVDSYNPWAFEVVYGEFSNSTPVELALGLGQVRLVVHILRPDLLVERMELPDDPEPLEDHPFSAVVANGGGHPVGGATVTFYYRNEAGFQRVMGETQVGPLAPGETEVAAIWWAPPSEGRFHISVAVDVDDRVDEEVEDNNRLEEQLEVTAAGGGLVPSWGALAALAAVGLVALGSVAVRELRG